MTAPDPMEAAVERIARELHTSHCQPYHAARALLAEILPPLLAEERERCAKLAEGFDDPARDWLAGSVWANIRRDIAAAIRNQEPKL